MIQKIIGGLYPLTLHTDQPNTDRHQFTRIHTLIMIVKTKKT